MESVSPFEQLDNITAYRVDFRLDKDERKPKLVVLKQIVIDKVALWMEGQELL